jgi:D-glycero-alpha-D-manno-heptose 1-phosphate guanylyltransferase
MNHLSLQNPPANPQASLISVQNTCAVLLVGGLGTRLQSVVKSKPKPLASVGNSSFLALLVRQLRCQGIRRIVMCTGYLAEQIENEFGDGRDWDVAIQYSKEPHPLGTAGALRLAEPYVRGASDFLVMNGDSFLEIDFGHMLQRHHQAGGMATIAVRKVKNASRYGTVEVDAANRVVGFTEKTGSSAPGLVNAGVYVFKCAIFEHIPEGPVSLERGVFPRLLDCGVYALQQHGIFIDIGTPDDYARAQKVCDRLYQAALNHQTNSCADKGSSELGMHEDDSE